MNIPSVEDYKVQRFKREEKIRVEQGREKCLYLGKFQEKVSLALSKGERYVHVCTCGCDVGEETIYSVLRKVCGELKKKNYAVRVEDNCSGLKVVLYIEPKEKMRWWHWFLGWRWM